MRFDQKSVAESGLTLLTSVYRSAWSKFDMHAHLRLMGVVLPGLGSDFLIFFFKSVMGWHVAV